jgi:surface-anchored protein
MKTPSAETKPIKTPIAYVIASLALFFSSGLTTYATTTLSLGHVDAFEVHYSDVEGFNLEVHVEEGNQHLEPGNVIFQVNQAAYGDLGNAQLGLGWSNANAWVLPALAAETKNINGDDIMLFLGVAGENESTRVWNPNKFKISLLSAGNANPGDFALYRYGSGGNFSNPINTVGGLNSTDFIEISAGSHEHWNWAFSAAGTYTFEFQASGTHDVGGVSTPALTEIETYTFNVIPEPSSSTLLLIGFVGWVATRKRVVLKE